MRYLPLIFLLAGCPKQPPPPPAPVPTERPAAEPAPAVAEIRTGDQLLASSDSQRVMIFGTLVQRPHPEGDEGLALQLDDGALVWLGLGEAPHGWDWLLDTEVRVLGTLRLSDGQPPILADPDAPMPADAGMELFR